METTTKLYNSVVSTNDSESSPQQTTLRKLPTCLFINLIVTFLNPQDVQTLGSVSVFYRNVIRLSDEEIWQPRCFCFWAAPQVVPSLISTPKVVDEVPFVMTLRNEDKYERVRKAAIAKAAAEASSRGLLPIAPTTISTVATTTTTYNAQHSFSGSIIDASPYLASRRIANVPSLFATENDSGPTDRNDGDQPYGFFGPPGNYVPSSSNGSMPALLPSHARIVGSVPFAQFINDYSEACLYEQAQRLASAGNDAQELLDQIEFVGTAGGVERSPLDGPVAAGPSEAFHSDMELDRNRMPSGEWRQLSMGDPSLAPQLSSPNTIHPTLPLTKKALRTFAAINKSSLTLVQREEASKNLIASKRRMLEANTKKQHEQRSKIKDAVGGGGAGRKHHTTRAGPRGGIMKARVGTFEELATITGNERAIVSSSAVSGVPAQTIDHPEDPDLQTETHAIVGSPTVEGAPSILTAAPATGPPDDHGPDEGEDENWFQREADRQSDCQSDITLWSTSNGSLEKEFNHEYQQLLLSEQQQQQELEDLMKKLKDAKQEKHQQRQSKRRRKGGNKATAVDGQQGESNANGGQMEALDDAKVPVEGDHRADPDQDDAQPDEYDDDYLYEDEDDQPHQHHPKVLPSPAGLAPQLPSTPLRSAAIPIPDAATSTPSQPGTYRLPSPTLRWSDLSVGTQRLVMQGYADAIEAAHHTGNKRQRTRGSRSGHSNRSVVSLQSLANSNKSSLAPRDTKAAMAIIGEHVPSHVQTPMQRANSESRLPPMQALMLPPAATETATPSSKPSSPPPAQSKKITSTHSRTTSGGRSSSSGGAIEHTGPPSTAVEPADGTMVVQLSEAPTINLNIEETTQATRRVTKRKGASSRASSSRRSVNTADNTAPSDKGSKASKVVKGTKSKSSSQGGKRGSRKGKKGDRVASKGLNGSEALSGSDEDEDDESTSSEDETATRVTQSCVESSEDEEDDEETSDEDEDSSSYDSEEDEEDTESESEESEDLKARLVHKGGEGSDIESGDDEDLTDEQRLALKGIYGQVIATMKSVAVIGEVDKATAIPTNNSTPSPSAIYAPLLQQPSALKAASTVPIIDAHASAWSEANEVKCTPPLGILASSKESAGSAAITKFLLAPEGPILLGSSPTTLLPTRTPKTTLTPDKPSDHQTSSSKRRVAISQEYVDRHDARHLQQLQRKAAAMVNAMDSDGFVPKVVLQAVDSAATGASPLADHYGDEAVTYGGAFHNAATIVSFASDTPSAAPGHNLSTSVVATVVEVLLENPHLLADGAAVEGRLGLITPHHKDTDANPILLLTPGVDLPQDTNHGLARNAAPNRKPAPPMVQVPPPRAALYEWLSAATAALPVSIFLGAVDKATPHHQVHGMPAPLPHKKDPLAPAAANAATTLATKAPDASEDTDEEDEDNEPDYIDLASLPAPRVLYLPASSVMSPTTDDNAGTHGMRTSPKAPSPPNTSPTTQPPHSTMAEPPQPAFEDDDEAYLPLAQRSMRNAASQVGPWKHAYVSSIQDAKQAKLSKEEILQINWEMAITAPQQLPQVLRAMVVPPAAANNDYIDRPNPAAGGIKKVPMSFDTDGMARTDVFPVMHYQIVSDGTEVSLGALQRLRVHRGELTAEALKPTAIARPPPRPLGSGSAGVGLFAGLMRNAQTPAPQPATTPSSEKPSLGFSTYVSLWSYYWEDKADRQPQHPTDESTQRSNPQKSAVPTTELSFTDRWKWTISNTALQIGSTDIPRPEYVKLLLQNNL